MKHKLATTLLVVAALVVSTFATLSGAKPAAAASNDGNNFPGQRWPINGGCPEKSPPDTSPPCAADNAILIWDEMLLRAIRLHPATTGPTVTSRALAILHTATYDAWAAYDSVAVPTLVNGNLQPRQPVNERTGQAGLDNKREAISYAAYRVLRNLFPAGPRYPNIAQAKFDEQMTAMGYRTDGTTPTTAAAVGARAADAVITSRANDGSNQGGGYADTTNYQPVNTWDHVNVPWRWQPLCIPNPSPPPGSELCPGGAVQKALTPQWKNVTPFALNSPNQFQPPGPPRLADGTYDPKDIDTALADTSNLTDTKKVLAEYWADGPKSEFPPGHWAVIAQAVSRKRGHSIDTDAKMFFVLGNAVLDAGISAWSAKFKIDPTNPANTWDTWRPITAIRERYKGKLINSWKGPYQGYGLVPAEQWRPYQAPNVVTPPFPEYTSGHSTFSGAARIAIIAFTGNDSFNSKVTIPAGTSLFEPKDATHPVGTPAKDVVLSWKTLMDASDQAGMSRRYGGIHFYSGDMHGRTVGGSLGYWVYDKSTKYFDGTATPVMP